MKVVFVYPDFESLGVESLMSVCMEKGHSVELVHYKAQDVYFGEKVKSVNYDELAERVADTGAQVAAFSCVTDNFQFQLRAARALKAILPDILTIFGGIHVTAVPEKVLANPEVDAVAVGEGEVSFLRFLERGDGKTGKFVLPDEPIRGIVYKKDGRLTGDFVEEELVDLDSLPIPYKKPFADVLDDVRVQYYIMTSRGCPYKCAYCFNSYLHQLRGGTAIRRRSVDNVIRELEEAKQHWPKMGYVLFLDDCFTTNQTWLLEFCRLYKEKIALPFGCITSPFYLNEEKAEALAAAGCINVQLGIQTLSEDMCKNILKRSSSNEKIANAITIAKRAGMMVQVDHMFGIPHDTLKLQEEAALFYNKYRPHVISTLWLTYYPKTTIIDTARAEGIISDADIEKIEQGLSLTNHSLLNGGSLKNPEPFYSICFLMNWLPLLPRFVVAFLVRSHLYKMFSIKNYFFAIALPRAIQSVFNRKDYRARNHIKRFIGRLLRSSIDTCRTRN
ncbi:MAG: B12-binding domain-containing radical SAM protein [Deltaproteobacteria bacterium]|nr:B12-binding domain-containing radical SAM protein [Deltaproteobacteria bacterium]